MFRFTDFQLRVPNPADPLLQREPQCLPDGVLEIGKGDGTAWRYLPEGYAPPPATLQALLQLSEDLTSLRSIAATDADLEAEIVAIQAQITALGQAGSTPADLAPLRAAIDLLSSSDTATATAIAAVQLSVTGLDATYATDLQLSDLDAWHRDKAAELEGMIASFDIRSAIAPPTPVLGRRWIEVTTTGLDRYDFAWIWSGAEWQSDRRFILSSGSGRITGGSAPRQDLGFLPPHPGLAGFRLMRASVKARLDGPGSWTANLRKQLSASQATGWLGPLTIASSGIHDFVVPETASLLPIDLVALSLELIKIGNPPDSAFALSTQFVAVRA